MGILVSAPSNRSRPDIRSGEINAPFGTELRAVRDSLSRVYIPADYRFYALRNLEFN
jgi:hypothetical protein